MGDRLVVIVKDCPPRGQGGTLLRVIKYTAEKQAVNFALCTRNVTIDINVKKYKVNEQPPSKVLC